MFHSKLKKGFVALLTGAMVVGSIAIPTGAAESAKSVTVNQDKIFFGNIEDTTNKYRIELRNEYGSTKDDSVLDPKQVVASDKVSVTFTISGLDKIASVKDKSYNAFVVFADASWGNSNWDPGTAGDVTVKGDGTYTVSMLCKDSKNPINQALVFCVDIPDLAKDLKDAGAVINNFKKDGDALILDSEAKPDVTITNVAVDCYDVADSSASDDADATDKADTDTQATEAPTTTDAADDTSKDDADTTDDADDDADDQDDSDTTETAEPSATTAATATAAATTTTDDTKTTGDVSLALVYSVLVVCAGGLIVANLRKKVNK